MTAPKHLTQQIIAMRLAGMRVTDQAPVTTEPGQSPQFKIQYMGSMMTFRPRLAVEIAPPPPPTLFEQAMSAVVFCGKVIAGAALLGVAAVAFAANPMPFIIGFAAAVVIGLPYAFMAVLRR